MEKCEKCGGEIMLCLSDWPWHEDYWICEKCESTYCYMHEKEKKEEVSHRKMRKTVKSLTSAQNDCEGL